MKQYLTDAWVGSVIVESRTDFYDEVQPGLMLRVGAGPGASKTWYVRYRRAGRQRRLKLGLYPTAKLRDARADAKAVLRRVDAGEDPQRQRLAERTADSFAELAWSFVAERAKVEKRSWQEDVRKLNCDVLPALGNLPAKSVQRADVKRLLRGIAERGAPVAAHRTGALISRIFNYGLEEGLVDANPALRLPRFTKETSRSRVLSHEEIAAAWSAWESEHPVMRAALQFLLLTGQRRGEVLGARWEEIVGEWWEIPGARTKNGRDHRVPLSPPARALLDALPRVEGSPWVFPSWRGSGHVVDLRPAIRRAAKRWAALSGASVKGEWFTPHDLRRTVLTNLAEQRVPLDVRKAVANHKGRADVAAIYDRHDRAREKRQALDAWARRLDAIATGRELQAQVVELIR